MTLTFEVYQRDPINKNQLIMNLLIHFVMFVTTFQYEFLFFLYWVDHLVLEKEMATYSSVLARRIPGKGEPGGLPSMGSHRVGHD